SVFSRGDLSRTVEIRDDGMISFPLLGNLKAAGLTVPELQLVITERLKEFMRKPQVDIQIEEYRSQRVFVLGEVGELRIEEYPGYVPLKGKTTVLEAIAMAGGLKRDADLRGAYVIREREISPVDFYRLINEGDLGQNIELKPKDTLYIPSIRDKVVYVVGEVNRPRLVPVGLEGLDISGAIAQAGDFKISARKGDVKVIRGGLKQPTVISINFNRILQGDPHENIRLYAGDIVFAPASILGEWNKIVRLLSPSLNSALLGANVRELFVD
ncbi:MAG: SLBB domain-containing protein, partial [Thermodesulfobacteriota bacterium]